MSSLQQQIAEKFLKSLAESQEVDAARIEQLRLLMMRGKKPKADEFVRIFTAPAGGEVK